MPRLALLKAIGPATLAILLLATPAEAAGVSPAQATPVQREQAQSRFLKGKELFKAGKHEAALAEFNASLDVVVSPNTRLFIARTLREMGRLVPAYAEFGRSAIEARELAREDPRYEGTATAATEERRDLEPKLGFVEVSITHAAPTTTLKVASDDVRRGGWAEPIPVMPGTSEVTVETPGHAAITKSVTLRAGEKTSLAIDAGADAPAVAVVGTGIETPPDSDAGKPKYRTYAYAAGGVAAAGLLTFAIAGILANDTFSDLESQCGNKPCPPDKQDDVSKGRTQQTIANVGLAVFVIGAAGAVTLWVMGTPRKAPAQGTATVAPTAPHARITAGPSFVGVQGAF